MWLKLYVMKQGFWNYNKLIFVYIGAYILLPYEGSIRLETTVPTAVMIDQMAKLYVDILTENAFSLMIHQLADWHNV